MSGDLPQPIAEFGTDRFVNREMSWLDFNARVLALAVNPDTPLLERAKFLAIFTSTGDEFFQVRVAGLMEQVESGVHGDHDVITNSQGPAGVRMHRPVEPRGRRAR